MATAEAEIPAESPGLTYRQWAREVRALAAQRDAVILAHSYQVPWIQEVADFVGDSLELSRQAAATPARVIVFCGVHFMAETAKVLSPERTVLIPDVAPGCPRPGPPRRPPPRGGAAPAPPSGSPGPGRPPPAARTCSAPPACCAGQPRPRPAGSSSPPRPACSTGSAASSRSGSSSPPT